jgi:peptidoglycan/LPS O-acetylase OafA/YrhL
MAGMTDDADFTLIGSTMKNISLPRLSFKSNSTLAADSYQSLIISLLRGLAALQVALAHLRAETYPSLRGMNDAPIGYQFLAFSTGFAHQAVVVFFLISGWLVGGSLLNKWSQHQSLASYAIDRISRLWTVLIPTFSLMLISAWYMDNIVPAPSHFDRTNEYSVVSLAGNLAGLQTISVPNFGKNYALWSLANETWYYILFPLVLFVFRCKAAWRKAASALAIAGIASFLPVSILLYFSLWLLGAGFSKIRIECGPMGRAILLLVCVALSVYFRLTGRNADLIIDSFVQDLVCSLPFLTLLASMHHTAPTGSAAMRHLRSSAHVLSEFSFTLYVTHVPAIALLRYLGRTYLGRESFSPNQAVDYFVYFGTASLLVAVAFLSYLAFESNTVRVRKFLKERLLRSSLRRPVITAAPVK